MIYIYKASSKFKFDLFADHTNLLHPDKNIRLLELIINDDNVIYTYV